MCHATGQLDQTLDAAEGLGEGEDLCELAEALGGGVTALDAEGEHAAAHAVAVLALGDGSVRVGVEARVVDGDDVRGGLEGGRDGRGVARGLAGAEVERLQPPVGEPRVKGRGHGADGVLEEAQALLEVGGVEGGDAHDDVAVAVDVLGHAVDDDVGAVVERVLDVGGEEGVVDDDEDAVAVGDAGNGADVDEAEGRVTRGLDPDEARVLVDVLRDVDLDLGRERHLDAVGLCDLREIAVGAAVHIRDGDDVRACGQALEDGGRGSTAAGEGQRIARVLEGRHSSLEVIPVRVGGARVLVVAYGAADGGLGECGREGDGLDDGAGDRVMRGSGMDGEGAEAVNRSGWPGGRLDHGDVCCQRRRHGMSM